MTAAAGSGARGGLPGWVRKLGIPLAGFLLVFFFLLRGFPYDALSERLSATLEPSIQLQIGELGLAFQWAGPALEASGVRAVLADGQTFRFDRVLFRPAWSTSWFALAPALYIELDGPLGAVSGVAEVSDTPSWDGSVTGLDLSALPVSGAMPGAAIDGKMDATIDLRFADTGPEGTVAIQARDGSVSIPNVPVALPYESLTGDLVFGGDTLLSVETLTLEGPIATASGGGTIARAPSLLQGALQMEFSLEVKPALASVVRSAGLRVDRQGATKVRLSGTVSNPTIR